MKWRKKPLVIDAVQMDVDGAIYDRLHDTDIPYKAGDWVITGIKGEQYPCKDEVFRATYEPAE
jgi:hypothetical protein